MLSKRKSFITIIFLLVYSSLLFSQPITNNWVSGKWKIEEVILPENKFNDKREKKLFNELAKTILHFKGDGSFLFIYDGSEEEVKRNIKQFENSIWRIIEGENIISLEKEVPLAFMPVENGEKIIFGFIKPVKFQVQKIEDEKVNFLLKSTNTQENTIVDVEQKIDSVFKQVNINEEILKNDLISRYPIVETCEDFENTSRLRTCFNRAIREIISDKLDLKKYESLAGNSRFRFFLDFVIDIDGVIKNINVEFPDAELCYDLKLIVNNIKVISPAKNKDGELMLSTYTIPLTLMMQ
ncbi:hypothetical protein [Ascidiimonas sp. W6]|uniref:hypothetical protein n=1 Tax=Ascidiimonas meishanensis TaxID=3128903 RepID=UPI0030ECCCDA